MILRINYIDDRNDIGAVINGIMYSNVLTVSDLLERSATSTTSDGALVGKNDTDVDDDVVTKALQVTGPVIVQLKIPSQVKVGTMRRFGCPLKWSFAA